jgi:hypothetical protein
MAERAEAEIPRLPPNLDGWYAGEMHHQVPVRTRQTAGLLPPDSRHVAIYETDSANNKLIF